VQVCDIYTTVAESVDTDKSVHNNHKFVHANENSAKSHMKWPQLSRLFMKWP